MSLVASSLERVTRRDGALAAAAHGMASPWTGAGLVAFAAALQGLGHQNPDNSWLFTVAEKVVDGARPYVDVIESNPPAAFIDQVPAVYFARFAHVSVECVSVVLVLFVCVASACAFARVLRVANLASRSEAGVLRNGALFALALLPGFSFGEREHIACALVLPILAVYAARAAARPVGPWTAAAAGLAAAFAAALKPHFAIAVALPFLYVLAIRARAVGARRCARLLVEPEQVAIVAGALANLAIIATLFPAFFHQAAVSLDVYVPMRMRWPALLTQPWFIANVALLVGLAATFGRTVLAPRVALPALSSLGFVVTFLIQRKGWVNHGLPGVELAFVAIAAAAASIFAPHEAEDREEAWRRVRRPMLFFFLPAAVYAPILFGALLSFTGFEEYKGLTAAVLRDAPARPRVIALAPDLDVGHPLTRRIGGEWVGRPNATWLMIFARMYLDAGWGDGAYRARLQTYIDEDARMFREDVERHRPDVVLVARDARVETAMRDPDVAAAMADYAPREEADGVAVWTRKPGR